MADYDTFEKDTLVYLRDTMRNDTSLMVTILGLSGTSNAVNHVFVQRPANEKLSPDGVPNFKLPRIVIDKVTTLTGKQGNNQDGQNESSITSQISFWVEENPFDLSLKTADRIRKLFESDNQSITSGWANNEILFSDDIKDPDRMQTRLGTIRIRTNILGG